MDMEIEAPQSQSHQNHITNKKLGLKNCIQTNFGEDYVFQIVPKNDWTSMAVSLSTNVVKLYSPVTGQYCGECRGHSSTINDIAFFGDPSPHMLHSCSSDGTIRGWDTRTFNQVSCTNAGPSQEIFSFSFGGAGDNLVAAGCKSQILLWDMRNSKQVASLEDSHVDDVTQVHFIPGHHNKLLSASEDGLMCIFDTEGDINDDDNMQSVINVETSIGKVGFLGEKYEKIWCLTNIETLRRIWTESGSAIDDSGGEMGRGERYGAPGSSFYSEAEIIFCLAESVGGWIFITVWDWNEGSVEVNFQDARSLASNSWALDHVDYFVDRHYSQQDDKLWVIGGTNAGNLGYFPVTYKGTGSIGCPEAILEGGHTGVVRSALIMPTMSSGQNRSPSCFSWTGGEDGRLCCWLADESNEVKRSWISNDLVVKSPKLHRKNRHSPY